jgi:hypothetical protein
MKILRARICLIASLFFLTLVTDSVQATEVVQKPQVKRLDLVTDKIEFLGKEVLLLKEEGLINKGTGIMQRIVDFLPGKLSQVVDTWWFGVVEGDNAGGGQFAGEFVQGVAGGIAVGQKILENYSQDEIAFVIAHEVAHVVLGHHPPQIGGLFGIFFDLKLKRELEIAANDWAITFMQIACFDVEGVVRYFETRYRDSEMLVVVKNWIENPRVVAKPLIISSLEILELPPYTVDLTITAKFAVKNEGSACITFDVLTVGGRLNNNVKDFEWKTNIELPPKGVYNYQGKLKLESPGNYHFFTAYRTKDGQWNTAIPTTQEVTNTKDIKVEPTNWNEYNLGALFYSVPSDWKVFPETKADVFTKFLSKIPIGKRPGIGVTRMYYTDKGQTSITVGVLNALYKEFESGQIRIIHSDDYGGKIIEEPLVSTQRSINSSYMREFGRLIDSFKTEIAGLPVTVLILKSTEKESVAMEGKETWAFNLIKKGKHYAFYLCSVDREFQSLIFKELISRIRFLP